jgi:tRNA-uridine 2-sulfurtransferase
MKRIEGRKCKIVVAMSGGVDSSTVAGLLKEQGHDVIGITMKLYDNSELEANTPEVEFTGTCCSLDDVSDARRVADHIGIPFYVGNYEKAFMGAVVNSFVEAYASGRTPNPCVKCNDVVKFRTLLAKARALGADYLATGHYARTESDTEGNVVLLEGRDVRKDQSYFLAGIPKKSLQRVIFPLGDMTKDEVRDEALRLGLPVASKPESQDICFIPDNNYSGFLESKAPEKLRGPGPIIGVDGLSLGKHKGLHRYTVGQRKGLGIAAESPYYVVGINPKENTLKVGHRADAYSSGLWASGAKWLTDTPHPGTVVRARIRHNDAGALAKVSPRDDGGVNVYFDEPVLAVTPGQQLALYDGRRVLGAATIEGPLKPAGESAHGS